MEQTNLIYGRNPIKEAIKSKRVRKVYITKNFAHHEILKLISDHTIPKIIKTNDELSTLCKGAVHQGIAAEIKPYEYVDIDYLIHKASTVNRPIIVMLDGINDPHNFGAVIRNCDAFGVSGVIIGKHNQVPLNATVAKTSAGAINNIPVAIVTNLNQAIAKLKDAGYWVVSSDGSGKLSYLDLEYDFPTVLIIGSEGDGISSLVLKNSDYVVSIPMYGQVNSLNASCASAVLLANIKKH